MRQLCSYTFFGEHHSWQTINQIKMTLLICSCQILIFCCWSMWLRPVCYKTFYRIQFIVVRYRLNVGEINDNAWTNSWNFYSKYLQGTWKMSRRDGTEFHYFVLSDEMFMNLDLRNWCLRCACLDKTSCVTCLNHRRVHN